MNSLFSILIVAALLYFAYELVTWIYASKNPPDPYANADPTSRQIATVVSEFTGPEGPMPRTGKVQLNGTNWAAETSNTELSLDVGDKCKVISRNGLTLVVSRPDDD